MTATVSSPEDLLAQLVAPLGVVLSPEQRAQFKVYRELLQRWNRRINLTAVVADEAVVRRHFADSLTYLRPLGLEDSPAGGRLVDVGTGAGFPGLPLKICRPVLQVTLLDAERKRIEFLRFLCRHLHLTGVELLLGRAETWGQDTRYREQFDWAVARAVAPLAVLAEYCLPFLRLGGRFAASQGGKVTPERRTVQAALEKLGGEWVGEYRVPDSLTMDAEKQDEVRERWVVVITKVAPTPLKYPRRVGVPARRPLA